MKTSVLYVLPAKMGGVVTNLSTLQANCDPDRFDPFTILTRNTLDGDTPFDGRMTRGRQLRFDHSLPLENLYSVLRRFHRAVPPGGGVLVASDWLELAWVCAQGTDRAVFQILHGDFDYYYQLALRHEPIVDVFIACSRFIRDKLTALLPGRADSIHYVPYGVPILDRTRAPAKGPLRLVYAGRLEQNQKRIFDLPRIAEALERRRVSVEWTIAGGGPDEDELRRRWAFGSVRWVGVLSPCETLHLLPDHDVFVLPSAAEGLPVALLEAMSAGLVPVATDLASGVPELVLPGRTGFLVTLGDVEGFADAISSLAGSRTTLEAMSASARGLVSERFSAARQASLYQALFERWQPGRTKAPGGKVPYGSRLDQPWIPNVVVRWIRKRRRPELRRQIGARARA